MSFSHHCYNCQSCEYCYDCDNLEGKKYHIANQDYHDKQSYEAALKTYVRSARSIERLSHGRSYNNENVSDYMNVINSKNAHHVVDVSNVENFKYVREVYDSSDCYDMYSWGENTSR